MFGLREDSWIFISVFPFNLSQYHTLCSLWKTPVYTCEKMRMKKAHNIFMFYGNSTNLTDPLKEPLRWSGSPAQALRATVLENAVQVVIMFQERLGKSRSAPRCSGQ